LRRKQPAATNEKIFSFYPYEVVSYHEDQKTVPSESITQIPFENQCRSALNTLIRTAEKAQSQYHYVKFPFGLMDTKGLKDLLAFYDHRNALKRTLEEKNGLTQKPASHTTIIYVHQ